MSYDVYCVSYPLSPSVKNPLPAKISLGCSVVPEPGSNDPELQALLRCHLRRLSGDAICVAVEVEGGEYVSATFSLDHCKVIATNANFNHNPKIIQTLLEVIPACIEANVSLIQLRKKCLGWVEDPIDLW